MRNIKKIIAFILFITSITFSFLTLTFRNNKINASSNNEVSLNPDKYQIADEIGYLYNFDDSPDYIYIDFIDNAGYAIFSETTLEILEYSENCSFPFEGIKEKKYYGGPYQYYVKINNEFKNIITSEVLKISNEVIKNISTFSRSIFNTNFKNDLNELSDAKERISTIFSVNINNDSLSLNSTENTLLSPPLDLENWINPTADATYIDNVEYFMTPRQSPRHGDNNGESCTTIAIQLLLSYNNYYNDRRIIDPQYLFGNLKNTSSNLFDRNNYENPNQSLYACSNPNTITSEIIGSNQTFHDYLYSKNITGFLYDAKTNLGNYLNERGIDYDIECETETTLPFGLGEFKTINPEKITSKIDEGKPVVLSTSDNLNGTTNDRIKVNHFVIAYGYQTLSPYTSSGNNNSYLGYIVHMGWDPLGVDNLNNVWTNSDWFYSYLSIDINHVHNHNIITTHIVNGNKIELRCSCGHRTTDDLFIASNNTIIGSKYAIYGEINIPTKINGIEIQRIGESAFRNCVGITDVDIPNSVKYIDSNAFEGCSYLQSVTLSNNMIAIGSSAFKGCTSLARITIPNSVTNIDSNAFDGCTSLKNVNLPNKLKSIGTSIFKGCTSLKEITIPNSITNIDSNAFEGCTRLKEVILSNTLHAIGTQAFKDCTRLSSIIFPSSVQYIDDEAFKNCSALSLVTVNREISDITNLGENVFEGTHTNLQIVVPTNRIAEYKNKVYWSSYRNKIIPSGQYSELTLNCESNLSNIVNLNQSYNKLYKLNVNCSKAYKFNVTSTIDVNIIVYDINMNVLSNSCNIATPFLSCGTYYISLEFVDPNGAGSFEMLTSLRWTSADIQLLSGVNEIKNSMHLNNENVYHCKYYYNNNQGAGFYKISLNTGSNIAYPEGTMKIYSDSSRTTILNRYGTTGINKQAITDSNENEIYLYLPEGRSYIDIALPLTTYSSISLTIEQVESNNLNYLNTLSSTCLDEIFVNKTLPIYFEEVIISHRSTIQLDIMTNGTITDNIPVYIMSKEKENGYDIGVEIYRLKLKLRDYITKSDRGPVFTTILDPRTYYIGYTGNNNNVSINLVIKRLVNQELNINGTLVADPANDLGFIAGNEVTLNGGSFRGNTITEGFTRHLYLMVENVLEEPMSRLEYDWYSSNENAAKVTAYGTVLALNVNADTDVTIYAVQKDDPSRVYLKTFTIKKETETDPIFISCEMSYSYAQENGNYTLELDFSNSPFPYLAYYDYSIEDNDNIGAAIVGFGFMYSNRPGTVEITLNYRLNRRVFIYITLTITE